MGHFPSYWLRTFNRGPPMDPAARVWSAGKVLAFRATVADTFWAILGQSHLPGATYSPVPRGNPNPQIKVNCEHLPWK